MSSGDIRDTCRRFNAIALLEPPVNLVESFLYLLEPLFDLFESAEHELPLSSELLFYTNGSFDEVDVAR